LQSHIVDVPNLPMRLHLSHELADHRRDILIE
jgi:hypothetical protein